MKDTIILQALTQIDKYGFRKFSVEAVAADLGISKKTLYKHFATKHDLLMAVGDYAVETVRHQAKMIYESEGTWLDRFTILFYSPPPLISDQHLEELQRYFPELWDKTSFIREIVSGYAGKLISEGIEEGQIRREVNPDIIRLVTESAAAAADALDYAKSSFTMREAFKGIMDILLNGILVNSKEGEQNDNQA